MQHGDAAVELGLHIGIAGGREDHLAELFVLLSDCAACERHGDQAGGKQDSSRLRVHRKSPLWIASDGPRACSIDRVRLRLLLWLQILTVARSSCQRPYDADIRIGPRAAKPISNEWRNACPPRAQALPLIYRISARPIGSSPIEDYTTSLAPERAGDFRTCTLETSPDVRCSVAIGGWSQPVAATLYLRGKRWSVGWNGDFVEVLLRQRRRSYGIAGSVGSR